MSTALASAPAAATVSPRTAGPRTAWALLAALIVTLQFSPAIGLLGFNLTGDATWALSGGARDAVVLALVGLAAAAATSAQRQPLPRSAWWALLLVAVYGILALRSSSDTLVLAFNLRRLVLVPLLFVALALIPWTPAQVDRLLGLIVGSSVLVALLGVAERIAPQALWTDLLDIESYTAANGFDRFGLQPYLESGRFFSWDLEPWLGVPVRRMLSSYLEPTTLAACMALLLVAAQARQARGHAASAWVLLALCCGLATLSKGFALFLAVLAAWRLLGVPAPQHVWWITGVVCTMAVAAARLHLEGPLAHVAGLDSALRYLAQGRWLGEGIGDAGNYTNAAPGIGDESGLGNAIGQVGLAAVLSLCWVAALVRDVLATAGARRDPGGPWLAAWLLFWTVTYLLSASSLGVGGNALGFIFLALYLHPASGVRPR